MAAVFILAHACATFAQQPDPKQLFQDAFDAQQHGEAALAVRKYQELLRLRPDTAATHANLGLGLVSLGRFDEAITQFRAALAQAPGDRGLRAKLAMAYYEKGDLSKAAEEFSVPNKDQPGDVQMPRRYRSRCPPIPPAG